MELACTQATCFDLQSCRVITTARVMAKFSPRVVLRRKAEAANGVVGACPNGWAATLVTWNEVLPYSLRKWKVLLLPPKCRPSLVPTLLVLPPFLKANKVII